MARNRYGWQKRAKELARKQKNDDKMKRRQGKAFELEAEAMPEASEENLTESDETLGEAVETDQIDRGLQASPIAHD